MDMKREKHINKIKESKEDEIIEVPFELTKEEVEECFNHITTRKF